MDKDKLTSGINSMVDAIFPQPTLSSILNSETVKELLRKEQVSERAIEELAQRAKFLNSSVSVAVKEGLAKAIEKAYGNISTVIEALPEEERNAKLAEIREAVSKAMFAAEEADSAVQCTDSAPQGDDSAAQV